MTETRPAASSFPYLRELADRREAEQIRQLTSFGLTIGWLFTLTGGFCWFCVVSQIDWFWHSLFLAGVALILLGTLLPQALEVPHRAWMSLAHLQGRLVMTVVLTIFYLALITPLGWWERRRHRGSTPFHSWQGTPPQVTTAWEKLPTAEPPETAATYRRRKARSLISLFAETLAFFFKRGHYVLLPILILLLVLGLVLFFVQTSALAPFIYTIG